LKIFSLVLAALVAGNAFAAHRDVMPDPTASVVLKRLMAQEEAACVAVGLVADAGGMSFGCTPGAGPVSFDRDTLFEIGSITKVFTGLLLADMVRRGEVALSDPVSKYSRPGAELPKFEGREVTLLDLVTHTASIPRQPPGFAPTIPDNPYSTFTVDDLYRALAQTKITRPIGKAPEYSNFGFMWLSEMLSRRAGKPFETLLRERVLEPLGMKDTMITVPPSLAKRRAAGHGPGYRTVPFWDMEPQLAGVGGLKSSLADMMRFAETMAGRRDSPLKETIVLAFTVLSQQVGARTTAYAWSALERDGGRLYAHNGGTGGFSSALVVNPARRTAAFVLVDSQANFDDLAFHLVDAGMTLKQARVALPIAPAKIDEVAGRYELNPGFVLEVRREGDRAITQATGQGPIEIFSEGPDRFFTKVMDAQLIFQRGADGKVNALVLKQGGRDHPGRRLP